MAESTNFALGGPGELVATLEGWAGYLGAAAGAALGWLSSAREGSKAAQARLARTCIALGKHIPAPRTPRTVSGLLMALRGPVVHAQEGIQRPRSPKGSPLKDPQSAAMAHKGLAASVDEAPPADACKGKPD